MTQIDLFQTAKSSQPDTHASHFHLPGSAEAIRMTDISGHTYFPLFKPSDPLGAFSKMFMGTSLWASTKCYLTWKGKATPQGRSLFQLAVSMPRTDETESGLWATPRTTDASGGARPLDEKGRRISYSSNLVFGANLADQVKMWPTPAARDYKGANGYDRTKKKLKNGERAQMNQLPNAVMMQEGKQISGSLNPEFVTWMMGYPRGWTDLTDGSESQKTSQE